MQPSTDTSAAKSREGFRTARDAAMSGVSAKDKSVIDPTCGMATDAEKAAKTGNTVAYHGSTYYFCSAKCKEKFQSNPAEALKKHQGAVGD